ncbi:hypothetical protein PG999_012196 [Apiospora kogelbergensis]|uniref:Ankyrin repeat n=1 Tax=Apiospora kogelbergensis TaxID=1337665 RepID=A0AAW0QGG9_9PEZI
MEAIASISTVIGLFESAWKVKRLWDDFNEAPRVFQNIVTECERVQTLLKTLEAHIKDNLEVFQKDTSATQKHTMAMLQTVLENLTTAFEDTQAEIAKVTKKDRFDRMKFMWRKESSFQPLLDVMRKERDSVTMDRHLLIKVHENTRKSIDTVRRENQVTDPLPRKTKSSKTDQELKRELLVILEDDNADGLAQLLEEGASAECILNSRQDRPLHYVARKGNIKALQVLLQHRVSVNEPNENNATPLIAALDNHQVETSLALLAAEADPHARTRKGSTTLHYAAWGNLLQPLERLLAVNAEVNARDSEGKTPLHMAVQPVKNGKSISLNSKVLEALLRHGADPTLGLETTGLTPLHILAEAGKSSDLERLAKKARTLDVFLASSHDLPGATPLLLAAYHGNHISVQKLLECGADPNARSPYASTFPMALFAALDQRKYGSMKKLLEKGADPDCRLDQEFDAMTPLHHAAKIGDIKALECLLKYKASIDILDKWENTPLVKAVLADQAEAAELLVKSGADLEIPSSSYQNDTVLGRATEAGSLRMVHLLCRNGANQRGPKSKAYPSSPFLRAVCRGHLHCAIYLLAMDGGDVNQEGEGKWRPLHYASAHGQTEVVRWLLGMGADRTARSVKGETAESLARLNRCPDDLIALLTSSTT